MLNKILDFFGIRNQQSDKLKLTQIKFDSDGVKTLIYKSNSYEPRQEYVRSLPVGLLFSNTSNVILECKQCKSDYPLVLPMRKDIEEGKIKFGFFLGKNNKICRNCKSLYINLTDDEYWIFKHDYWKKVADDIRGFFDPTTNLQE